MISYDLHTHTVFSDGKNTPEEMVLSAIDKGLTTFGLSDHSYTDFDLRYCMKQEDISRYINEVNRLKQKYEGKIKILLGLEKDLLSNQPTDEFDYVIGSSHYFLLGDKFFDVDGKVENLLFAAKECFGGDLIALSEVYFKNISEIVERTNADIIGHFDLISKHNEGDRLFDSNDKRYISFYKAAVDKLITYGKPFEINTGAIARGYRTSPYPSTPIYEYIKQKGGKFVLTSDSHSVQNIAFEFDKWEHLLNI